ncbi:MAG: pyridoxamine kinase [Kiritimatiellae bacterium]|jgi:pyridoxine kinase|nr:pyridoxamine kinase [Kiritimatiellia bacterium]
MYKRVLSIQDISCVGQCSLTVALPLISACGVECAILPSAVLSNHTGGFKSWTFLDLTKEMSVIEEDWIKKDIRFDAFYTGYVCPAQIDPILHIMNSCANEGALRFVDPVMGDHGKMYAGFPPDFPKMMARLCNGADYIMPNMTEALFLLGKEPILNGYTQTTIESIIEDLHKTGAKNIVLTGVSFEKGMLGTAVSDGTNITYDFNEEITHFSHGTGDIFASVFTGAVMRGLKAIDAAALAADIICAALKETPEGHWYGVAFERTILQLAQRIRDGK